jgi:hypothetical protein
LWPEVTAAQGFFTLEKPHEAENPENSLFFSRELDLETGFAWLHPPPPSLPKTRY